MSDSIRVGLALILLAVLLLAVGAVLGLGGVGGFAPALLWVGGLGVGTGGVLVTIWGLLRG